MGGRVTETRSAQCGGKARGQEGVINDSCFSSIPCPTHITELPRMCPVTEPVLVGSLQVCKKEKENPFPCEKHYTDEPRHTNQRPILADLLDHHSTTSVSESPGSLPGQW